MSATVRGMNLSALLRDETLSAEDLMLKIQEDMYDAVHDMAFCEALENDKNPEEAAREALERLMDPFE